MLATGIIAPTRHSTWCSNLVVVRKKNGSLRICIDFINLNIVCQKDNYPLPNMETLLQRVMFPKNEMHANPKNEMHENPKSEMHANRKSDMHANPKSDIHDI